ncbi:Uncharacterized protein Adt_03246 [Abeliophyllum distichum]|uniref:RNase H type-1 domain-containing protein n=1 Tax=Abeliophyllum distichum TaxID=126358 RepID=A0ABD1W0E8_9LAMI
MTLAQMFPHMDHTSVQVVEFFDDTGWDIGRLLLVFPHYMVVQVESLPLCPDVLDRHMWKDTPEGLVPVDVIIQKRIRNHMASRCQCCLEIETIQHVFIDSPVTHSVWQHFLVIFGIPLKFVHWRGDLDLDLAPHFGITLISPIPNPPTLVYWRAPSAGSTKINTDGCVRDGFASGEGIIRDNTGRCIKAFSAGYGDIFILEAELRAILQGIELA